MDNWPWTSIVHGQLAMSNGLCPCAMANVHVLWPMSMKYFIIKFYGKFVHEILIDLLNNLNTILLKIQNGGLLIVWTFFVAFLGFRPRFLGVFLASN
jgi:hypothetical protein